MDKIELKMPRLGVNDDFVTLTEWLVEDHAYVTKGTDVAVIETSKETSELKAPADGYLHQAVQRDANVKVDALAGVITEEASFEFQKEEDAAAAYKITDKARALAEANGVDLSLLSHLKLIREKDVQALILNDDEIVRSKANDVIIVCGGGLSKMAIDLLQHNKAYNLFFLSVLYTR